MSKTRSRSIEATDGRISVSAAEPFESSLNITDELEGEVLRAVTDGSTKRSEIAAAVGRGAKDGTVGRALASLVKNGSLERSGKEYVLKSQGAKVPSPYGAGTLAPAPAPNEELTLAAIHGWEVGV